METNIHNKIRGDPISIMDLRSRLPFDNDDAQEVINRLGEVLELERLSFPEVRRVDLDVGTYVKAIRFVDIGNVEFIFNEGSSKSLKQSKGMYALGERIYKFTDSILRNNDLNVQAQDAPVRKLLQAMSLKRVMLLDNKFWLDALYSEFPKVRKKIPDYLYNLYDRNLTCERILHFRTYVTVGVHSMLKSLPQTASILIVGMYFTMDSKKRLDDIIRSVNSQEGRCKLSLLWSNDEEVTHSTKFIYYCDDFWVHPSKFSHGIEFSPQSTSEVDDQIRSGLGSHRDRLIVEGKSGYIASAYKPILDTYVVGTKIFTPEYRLYNYCQSYYVPHKPWSLISLIKGKGPIPAGWDSNLVPPHKRHMERVRSLLKMSYVNIKRNYLLSNDKCLKLMDEAIELAKQIKLLCGDPQEWLIMKSMSHPVKLSSKTLSTTEISTELACQVLVKVEKLVIKHQYTENELALEGWSTFMIRRALELELIVCWKSDSQMRYLRYERQEGNLSFHFTQSSLGELNQVSCILSDGSVVSADSRVSDSKVYSYPQYSFSEDEKFSLKSPYEASEFNQIPKPLSFSGTYHFKAKDSIEFNSLFDVSKVLTEEEKLLPPTSKSESRKSLVTESKSAKRESYPRKTKGIGKKKQLEKNYTLKRPRKSSKLSRKKNERVKVPEDLNKFDETSSLMEHFVEGTSIKPRIFPSGKEKEGLPPEPEPDIYASDYDMDYSKFTFFGTVKKETNNEVDSGGSTHKAPD